MEQHPWPGAQTRKLDLSTFKAKEILLRFLKGFIMSGDEAAAKLQEELSCSICLSCFSDPVSIHCGHNFCRACITKYWDFRKKKRFCCPKCRETSQKKILKPSRELKNIAEIATKLNVKVEETGGEQQVCKKHQEPLKLFCKDDQMLICVVCDKSKDHLGHTVIPMDEAAQQYKEQIYSQLKNMKQKKEMLLGSINMGATKSQEFQIIVDSEMHKTKAMFEQIHQFLEEQKQLLLAQWQSLQTATVKREKEEAIKLSEEISQLDSLITEAEGKCQQPSTEFLQDVESSLHRFKKRKLQESMDMSSDLEERMKTLMRKNTIAAVTLQKIEGTLPSELEKDQWESLAGCDTKTDSKNDLPLEMKKQESSSPAMKRNMVKHTTVPTGNEVLKGYHMSAESSAKPPNSGSRTSPKFLGGNADMTKHHQAKYSSQCPLS